ADRGGLARVAHVLADGLIHSHQAGPATLHRGGCGALHRVPELDEDLPRPGVASGVSAVEAPGPYRAGGHGVREHHDPGAAASTGRIVADHDACPLLSGAGRYVVDERHV